ncbi:hypothetical protein B0J18DRAFT_156006 [Chaetomium sp. MPI-SDFR-AT-0129]|nr:hypothetical protein B0J18DRAFT_156006 [Chaetomium sp. MPI-SDFR-AT-0129]
MTQMAFAPSTIYDTDVCLFRAVDFSLCLIFLGPASTHERVGSGHSGWDFQTSFTFRCGTYGSRLQRQQPISVSLWASLVVCLLGGNIGSGMEWNGMEWHGMAYDFCLVFLLVMVRWRNTVGILRGGNDGFDPLPLLLYALRTPATLMALLRGSDRESRVRIELGKRRLWTLKVQQPAGSDGSVSLGCLALGRGSERVTWFGRPSWLVACLPASRGA